MVVCKFFLQGECKFGENCKFEHQIPSYRNGGAGGSLFGSVQNQTFATKPTKEVDTNTLITSVQNDMIAVEKSGQWLLTCYAPFKEKPLFPGFQDQSFEEVRWGCYEARRTNTFEQYKQQLEQALLDAKTKFKALQTPTKDIVTMLRNIYNTPPSSGETFSNNQNSVFGAKLNSGGGIFSQNTQNFNQSSGSIFGKNDAPSVFGQQNQNFAQQKSSLFGQQSGSSIFSQNSGPQNSSSIFASASQGIFGNSNPINNSSNIFNAQQSNIFQTNQPQSSFSGANQNTINNFGTVPSQNSIFGQAIAEKTNSQPNNSIFSTPAFGSMATENIPNQSSQQIFSQQIPNAQPSSSSIFAGQNTPIFANQNSNSIFSSQTQSNSILNPAPPRADSIFGNSAKSNIFGVQNNAVNRDAYSKIEDLSEEDIKWFKSNDLDIENIPTKPPTYEMCFG